MKKHFIRITFGVAIAALIFTISGLSFNNQAQAEEVQIKIDGVFTQHTNGGYFCDGDEGTCGWWQINNGSIWFVGNDQRFSGDVFTLTLEQLNQLQNGQPLDFENLPRVY